MIQDTEIVLRPNGTAVRRTWVEEPCAVVDKIIEEMASSAVRVIKDVGQIDGMDFHLIKSKTETYCVMHLTELTILAPFKSGSDGLVYPDFADVSGENPHLPLKWKVPAGMILAFAARIYGSSGSYGTRAKDSCYLLAFDSGWNSYMLPLPNLFATGYLCMGEFVGNGDNIMEAMQKAYNQLKQSKWNSDLYDSARKAAVEKMMRFKPVEGSSFESVEYANWAALIGRCESVNIEILKGAFR